MPDGSSKIIMEFTSDELRAEAESRRAQGRKLIDDAESLEQRGPDFTEGVESLQVQGRKLMEEAYWMFKTADIKNEQGG